MHTDSNSPATRCLQTTSDHRERALYCFFEAVEKTAVAWAGTTMDKKMSWLVVGELIPQMWRDYKLVIADPSQRDYLRLKAETIAIVTSDKAVISAVNEALATLANYKETN